MAHDVFISYAMEDKPIADALHKMSFNPTNVSWWIRSKCYLPNEFDPLNTTNGSWGIIHSGLWIRLELTIPQLPLVVLNSF